MIDSLITSKTRVKLLLKFFLNTNSKSYLRSLESEFGESTNSIRLELNRLEEAGLLVSDVQSNRKVYHANTRHPLFPEIHNILRKFVGIDRLIDEVIEKLGDIKKVYLTGKLARGIDSKIIDIIIISDSLDMNYLLMLIQKAESLIKRKIRYLVLHSQDAPNYLKEMSGAEMLLIWDSDTR